MRTTSVEPNFLDKSNMTEQDNVTDLSIRSIFDDFLGRHPRGVLVGNLLLGWKEIVRRTMGEAYLKRTKAVRIYQDQLIIKCVDTETVSELFLHRKKLLTAYREQFEHILFSELHFVYGSDNPAGVSGSSGVRNASTEQVSAEQVAHPNVSHTETTEMRRGAQEHPKGNFRYEGGLQPVGRSPVSQSMKREVAFTNQREEHPSTPHETHWKKHHQATQVKKPFTRGRHFKRDLPTYSNKQVNPIYRKYVSEQELRTHYPEVGVSSAFLDGDDFF